MLTRTARRQSGSQQEGERSTASMPSAAALRKIAPMLVESTMPSSTATRRAVWHIPRRRAVSGGAWRTAPPGQGVASQRLQGSRGGRCTPRYRGSGPARRRPNLRCGGAPLKGEKRHTARVQRGADDLGAFSDEDAFFRFQLLRSCASVSLVYTASSGAERSVISMMMLWAVGRHPLRQARVYLHL